MYEFHGRMDAIKRPFLIPIIKYFPVFALRVIVILTMFKIVPNDFVFGQAKKSNNQSD